MQEVLSVCAQRCHQQAFNVSSFILRFLSYVSLHIYTCAWLCLCCLLLTPSLLKKNTFGFTLQLCSVLSSAVFKTKIKFGAFLVQPFNESVLKHMEMLASWPFANTGHVPASINRKMTIRVILDETKQNKKKWRQQTKFPRCLPLLHGKKNKAALTRY